MLPGLSRQPVPEEFMEQEGARTLEWQAQDGQNETKQPDHSASLGDSITASTRTGFRYTHARIDLNSRSSFRLLRSTLVYGGRPGNCRASDARYRRRCRTKHRRSHVYSREALSSRC